MRQLATITFTDDNELIEAYEYFYGIIYLLKNKITGKQYVGKTKGKFKNYINGYKNLLSDSSKRPIIRSMLKHGFENFECKIIDIAMNLKQLNDLERKYILQYNCKNPQFGYNVAKGGEGGVGGPHFTGHLHTDQTKQKMRNFPTSHFATNAGRVLDENWRKNIGKASSKRFKGIPKTEEHRKKLKDAMFGKIPVNKGKKLYIINSKRKYV